MLPIGPPQTRMKLGRPVAPEIGHEATGLDPRSSPGRPILTLKRNVHYSKRFKYWRYFPTLLAHLDFF
jgi:hypothetical protein